MPPLDANPQLWMEKLIALAILLQTLELLLLRHTFTEDGIWRWSVIQREFRAFPPLFQKLLDSTLRHPNFLFLLAAQMLAALVLLLHSHPAATFLMLGTVILICLRWRGTFNGGSDYMTIVVLSALCVMSAARGSVPVTLGCLWYVALQACSSYFLAGVVKLKQRDWRDGDALPKFVRAAAYPPPRALCWILERRSLSRLASWGIIVFECSFPLALLSSWLCLVYMSTAIMFHLANVYVFGLNRFLFAWLATYPALYFCSGVGFG